MKRKIRHEIYIACIVLYIYWKQDTHERFMHYWLYCIILIYHITVQWHIMTYYRKKNKRWFVAAQEMPWTQPKLHPAVYIDGTIIVALSVIISGQDCKVLAVFTPQQHGINFFSVTEVCILTKKCTITYKHMK